VFNKLDLSYFGRSEIERNALTKDKHSPTIRWKKS